MTTEAIELADTIDQSEETTGFERSMASVMRSQAAEIERLREILARALAQMRTQRRIDRAEIERLKAEAELFAKHVGIELARKDALLRVIEAAVLSKLAAGFGDEPTYFSEGYTAEQLGAAYAAGVATRLSVDNAGVER